MAFGFGKKKKTAPVDPIAAYDGLIEDLERQAAQVRKSVATLITLKSEMSRAVTQYLAKGVDIAARLKTAQERGDPKAESTLDRDRLHALKMIDSSRAAMARAEADGALLTEMAHELSRKVSELKSERTQARAQFAAGVTVSEALREQAQRVAKAFAVDAARDEVERAHALAEIYREEREAIPRK